MSYHGSRRRIPAVLLLSILALTPGWAGESVPGTTWEDREARFERFITFGEMVKGGVVTPNWMKDGKRFWHPAGEPVATLFLVTDAASGQQTELFPMNRVRPGLARLLQRDEIKAGVALQDLRLEEDESAVTFTLEERRFRFQLESGTLEEPTEPPGEDAPAGTPSPDGRWFVRAGEDGLFIRKAEAQEFTRLSEIGEADLTWSMEEAQWSADGDHFILPLYDARAVHKMPVVTWLPDQEEVEWAPYAHSGGTNYQASLYLVDATSGTVTPLDTGEEPDQTIVLLGWRESGEEALFMRLDGRMKRLDLMAVQRDSGRVRTILTDRQETFIEGLHLYYDAQCFHFPIDQERFLWRSERDGWCHLYLYRYDGTLVRRLTSGSWPVHEVKAVDHEGGWIYFTGQADLSRPWDHHLYRMDFEGKQLKQLTQGAGLHRMSISPAFTGFIDNHSFIDRPPSSELRRMDGTLVRVLDRADISELEALGWKPPEEFTVKGADGKSDVYGVLWKPHDFDPRQIYPVIEVIYAGSQMPAVPRRFVPREFGYYAQLLAQLNFVTVVLDSPGIPGRGKAYQDVVYRAIGRNEIPDHAAALHRLAEDRSWMDMTRVGVHGKSWGGYFALRAMLQAPETYHVGVASAVAADLATTAWSPVVPYMGTPEENPEGYALASCLDMADKLEGKLLISIATADRNTPFSQTMRMVEALIKTGKPVEMMVFPDQHHWLQEASLDYFNHMLKRYFVENLNPAGSR